MSEKRFLTGRIAPPDDLRPAIDKLTPKGRSFLGDLTLEAGKIEPWMIARAADYERGEHVEPEV